MPCFLHAPTGAPTHTDRDFALPGDVPHYPPDRPVDVRHVDLHLTVDFDRKQLRGTCTTTYTVLFDAISEVTVQAAEMQISAVTFSSKRKPQPVNINFDYDGEHLHLLLDRPQRYGQEFTLSVTYATTPRIGMHFVGPTAGDPDAAIQAHTQGQPEYAHYWFPCHDSPNDRATMAIAARVPQRYLAVANGRLERVEEHPETAEHTFYYHEAFAFPAYLATLAVAEFTELRDDFDETPVLYYVRPGYEAHARRMLGDTPAMLRYYSEHFGVRYPYERYAQVVLEQFTGAMENTAATSHTWMLLPDERALPDWEGKATVAHELVHQWFGDLLTCRDWSHAWLNESFATYFEETWKQQDPTAGELEFRLGMRNNRDLYLSEDRHYRRPIVYNVYDRDGQELFDRHLYEKGSCVLHMLRYVLGDAAFWRAIQHYAREHRGREVITADLERSIEEASGRSMGRFFEQWVYRGGHPDFEVAYEWDADLHLAKVTIKQNQKVDDLTPLFATPATIAFTLESKGKRETKSFTVHVEHKHETFIFPLEQRPVLVRFDPYGWLLKTLKFERPATMLRWQLANDEDAMGRLEAAEGLAKQPTPETLTALVTALSNDTFWAVRAEVAHVLGKIASHAALDALLQALATEQHPKARRAIVAALGAFHLPEHAADAERAGAALSDLLTRGDPSYLVVAQAATSLGKTRLADAYTQLLARQSQSSWHDLIFGGVATGLGELGTVEAAQTLAAWLIDQRRPLLQRQYSVAGLRSAILTGRLDPGGAVHIAVREALEAGLADHWVRVRTFSAQALRELDDERSLPALEAALDRELESSVRRQLRLALASIRSGKRGDQEARRLRHDLDGLRDEQRKFRERLSVVEVIAQRERNGAIAPDAVLNGATHHQE